MMEVNGSGGGGQSDRLPALSVRTRMMDSMSAQLRWWWPLAKLCLSQVDLGTATKDTVDHHLVEEGNKKRRERESLKSCTVFIFLIKQQ